MLTSSKACQVPGVPFLGPPTLLFFLFSAQLPKHDLSIPSLHARERQGEFATINPHAIHPRGLV